MYKICFYLFFQISFLSSFCAQDKLVAVVVLYRHGARTPVEPYPTDPYKDPKFWPVGFGQLTDEGKRKQFNLGKWLRQRYIDFLPQKYNEDDIYVRSTDVDRTLMSAEANLAGLYPPINNKSFLPNLKWQPIPVHSELELNDATLAMKKPCPKYEQLYKKFMKSPFMSNLSHVNHDLYAYLTRYSGSVVSTPDDVEYIYNTLSIEKSFNFTLPNWTENVFPDKMKGLAELSFALESYTPELARLKTGPFFAEIILKHFVNLHNDFHDKVKREITKHHHHNKSDPIRSRKFIELSAHDSTIANVLTSLGLFDMHCPPYTATILFEMRNNGNLSYINLFYKNETEPTELVLPECEKNCPLDKFIELLRPITLNLKEWEKECEVSWIDDLPFDHQGNVIAVSSLISISMILIFVLVGLSCTKNKQQSNPYKQLAVEEM